MKQIIISLYDYTGNWSRPYREAGYEVIQIDIQHGIDILEWDYSHIDRERVRGILIAQPCTAYANSGARWYEDKDKDGTTEYFNQLTRKSLEIVEYFKSSKTEKRKFFWSLENPIGRIEKCVPELKGFFLLGFNPCDYGADYTKYSKLWGEFNPWLIKTPAKATQGSKMHSKYGGKSLRTKNARSVTPMGFANAFFLANP